jgi:hypothetical protein
MKIYFIAVMVFILLFMNVRDNSKNEIVENQKIPYEKFIGKKIDCLLKSKKYKKLVIIDSKPGKANYLLVVYNDNMTIEIYPTKFKHMKEFDPKLVWDIKKFKLETIKKIRIYDHDKLVKEVN